MAAPLAPFVSPRKTRNSRNASVSRISRVSRRSVGALALALTLAGCLWFGGGGESRDDQTPHAIVTVKDDGPRDVLMNLSALDAGELVSGFTFTAKANKEATFNVPLHANATQVLRLGYQVDSGGHAASGSTEVSIEPASCSGVIHVTFVIRSGDALTPGGNHAECRPD